MKPWGKTSWLLPRIHANHWHVITSSSFEDRCLALVDWMQSTNQPISSSVLLRIDNPPSDQWTKAIPRIENNFAVLSERLASPLHRVINVDLLGGNLGALISIDSLIQDRSESVILDMTTLPKRFFLFALKQLLNSYHVKNLVVTYACADKYPESPLCEDALPPIALPAFGRIHTLTDLPRMVVGATTRVSRLRSRRSPA